jgi:predicted nucleotidyltransferase
LVRANAGTRLMLDDIYAELPSVSEKFLSGIRSALGTNFVSAYLAGAIATGVFDLDSDIDFLVVTNAELNDSEVQLLETNHRQIHALANYPAQHLEGSYIPREALRRTDLVGKEPLRYVDSGSTLLGRSLHDNRWHVRWLEPNSTVRVAQKLLHNLHVPVRPHAATAIATDTGTPTQELRAEKLLPRGCPQYRAAKR